MTSERSIPPRLYLPARAGAWGIGALAARVCRPMVMSTGIIAALGVGDFGHVLN